MARRSPSNPRYQKGSEAGKTRRSAASAKPKRTLGESAAKSSSPKGAKKKRERTKLFTPLATTPEFRRWRKIWMGLLVAAIVFSALAWWQRDVSGPIGVAALAAAYVCIFGSLYIDFAKMRPLRKAAVSKDQAKGGPALTKGDPGAKKAGKNEDASGTDA